MISATIWYEKGRLQNKLAGYRMKETKYVYEDSTGIIKDFYEVLNKNNDLKLDELKNYVYDKLEIKLDKKNNCYSIFDKNGNSIPFLSKDRYENIKEFKPILKSVSTYVLIVYGVMDEVNDLFNFYKIILDEFERDKKKNEWIISGPPIEKYIHGPWDTENKDEYEMEIHIPYIPYKWEDDL